MTDYSKDKLPILSKLVKGKDVLDIGCVQHNWQACTGDNWIHKHLKQYARSVKGIDILQDDIKQLKKLGFDVEYFDIEDKNNNFLKWKMYDVVFAGEIIEHLSGLDAFFYHCRYTLKNDGKLIITTVNCFSLLFIVQYMLGKLKVNHEHVCWFDMVTLGQLLKRQGFAIQDKYYLHRYQTGGKREWLSWLFYKFCPEKLRDNIMVVAIKI
jgi:2-polyprenyl-3-methyl-5-hydroxy-6-metoxy-1,4-benzoquinol methylase